MRNAHSATEERGHIAGSVGGGNKSSILFVRGLTLLPDGEIYCGEDESQGNVEDNLNKRIE